MQHAYCAAAPGAPGGAAPVGAASPWGLPGGAGAFLRTGAAYEEVGVRRFGAAAGIAFGALLDATLPCETCGEEARSWLGRVERPREAAFALAVGIFILSGASFEILAGLLFEAGAAEDGAPDAGFGARGRSIL